MVVDIKILFQKFLLIVCVRPMQPFYFVMPELSYQVQKEKKKLDFPVLFLGPWW